MKRNVSDTVNKKTTSPAKTRPTKTAALKNNPNVKDQRVIQSAAGGSRRAIPVSPRLQQPTPPQSQTHISSLPQLSDTPEEFITGVIHDFLIEKKMHKTCDALRSEMGRALLVAKDAGDVTADQVLDAFDKGNRELFFTRWSKFVPNSLRANDDFCQKLEFYLHIYFVVYSANVSKSRSGTGPSISKEDLNDFKNYLDTRGRDLAQTTEFLPYYALPYVSNPLDHPSFKTIFTKDWIMDIRGKLEAFLQNSGNKEQASLIYQMYYAYLNKDSPSKGHSNNGKNATEVNNQREELNEYARIVAQLEASNQNLMGILQDYNERFQGVTNENQILKKNEEIARTHLFESHTKWIAFLKELLEVTNQLVGVVDSQNRGKKVGENVLDGLKKRVSKYEAFLSSNLEDLITQSNDISTMNVISTSQDMGTPDHSAIYNSNNTANYRSRPEERSSVIQQSYIALNFEKIKSQMCSQTINEAAQCSLLQALRWRITRTGSGVLRREVIVSYHRHDLLDVRRNSPCVMDSIFKNRSRSISEYGARLINSLTSDYHGRTYLLENDKLVLILIRVFTTEKGDTVTRRNCLGALQKLSLRKKPQLIMIQKDIIQWIVHTLKYEKNSLGEYFYEYATALLMNLALRTAGKRKCEDPELEVLSILNELLEHENMQVRSFVNGTLYSLLANSVFREQAQALGMADILTYLMENSDERYRKQIHYVLERLSSDNVDEEVLSDNDEDDNDYDDIEDDEEIGEEDDMDDNFDDPNILTGEDLLRKNFSLSGPDAHKQTSMIQEALEESKSFSQSTVRDPRLAASSNLGVPLNRPTTPSMLSKLTQQINSGEDDGDKSQIFKSRPLLGKTPNSKTPAEFSYKAVLEENERTKERQRMTNKEQPVVENKPKSAVGQTREKVQPVEKNNVNSSFEEVEDMVEEAPKKAQSKNINDKEIEGFVTKPRILRSPPEHKMVKGSK